MKHIQPTIKPETIASDLRRRATLRRQLARGNGDLTDADYLEAAANEIERLRQAIAMPDLTVIQVNTAEAADQLCEQVGIPVIAEIEPKADPVYGHTFMWPAQEIEQFFTERNA